MAKKSLKRATKPAAPEAEARQSGRAFPAEPEELNGQQRQLRKTATAGAEALKCSPAATPDLHTTAAAASSPPLAPLAALWPTQAPAQAVSKTAQAPARQAQTRPVRVAAPEAPPAPAAPAVKLPVEWEPTTSPGKAAAVAEAPKPTATRSVKVTFVLLEPGAKQVFLCGEFNGWASDATPMKRDDARHWETTLALAPGRHEYKFLVDGNWRHDPLARVNVWNQNGTLNSVAQVWA